MIILIIVLAILAFIVIVSIGWLWGTYNYFVSQIVNIKTMWSNIKTEYQRRADLFYNLAESVKSYAKFEKTTLKDVIAMRGGNFGNSVPEGIEKMKGLDKLFAGLRVTFEAYPNLKANETYKRLMKEVRITEDRINIARTEYNDIVRDYNMFIVMFPSNTLARLFGFREWTYFESEAGSEKAPKMDLSID